MRRPLYRGFTLIELMVVVALMAILSAILVPWFLRLGSSSLEGKAKVESTRAELPQQPPEGALPAGVDISLRLQLEPEPLRLGLDVLNRYRLLHQGHYLFRLEQPSNLVLIPLPKESRGFNEVKILRRSGEDGWEVPQDPQFGDGWLAWLEPGPGQVEVQVGYQSEGQDTLWLSLPPAGVHDAISVQLDSPVELTVPALGLRAAERGRWTAETVLSPAPLVVELPPLEDPLSRVVRLFRLTGLAVLLFGAGFWYLAELSKAGSLSGFRFGSFALLACNYSLFFVCFAVLGFHEVLTPWRNLLLSAALTAPMLCLQVAHILGWRFALTRALPLSLATLGLVYNGVYGGDVRDFVYLGYALCVGLLLTVSYRPFSRVQKSRSEAREIRSQAKLQEYYAAQSRAREEREKAWSLLESGRLRASQAEELKSALQRFEERVRIARLPDDPGCRIEFADASIRRTIQAREDLARECGFIDQHVPATLEREDSCCLACGQQSRCGQYCCFCSSPLPEILPCPSCAVENVLPRHLSGAEHLHCHRCGHRHALKTASE